MNDINKAKKSVIESVKSSDGFVYFTLIDKKELECSIMLDPNDTANCLYYMAQVDKDFADAMFCAVQKHIENGISLMVDNAVKAKMN